MLVVYVNGQPVGLSKDARTPAEFDVTGLVRSRASQTNWCAWSRSGRMPAISKIRITGGRRALQREVYLYSTLTPHIQDVFARGELDDDFRDGTLDVTVKVGFPGEEYMECTAGGAAVRSRQGSRSSRAAAGVRVRRTPRTPGAVDPAAHTGALCEGQSMRR